MTYKSPTAYRGQETKTKSGSIVILGYSHSGKTRMFHQMMRAYGNENALFIDNGGPLDAILHENPMMEDARTYDKIGSLLSTLDNKAKSEEDLPLVGWSDDLSSYGDTVKLKWSDEKILKSTGTKDRKIERYGGMGDDGIRYIKRFNLLPMINVYCITQTPDGKLLFPGQVFISQLVRMVGAVITLRRYVNEDEEGNKSFRCHFDTMGRDGELGGDRTGILLPEEPPDLPSIIHRLYGLAPIHKYSVALNGEVTRNE